MNKPVFLSHEENKVDTRAKNVKMTNTGEQCLIEAFKVVKQIDDEIFDLEQQEQNDLKMMLLKCQEHV